MKKILITITIFFGIHSFAANSADIYLEANDNFLSEIRGDGFEKGFAWSAKDVEIPGVKAPMEQDIPMLSVEFPNNSADCRVTTLQLENVNAVVDTNTGSHTWLVDYRIEVDTSVEADTGGCMALISFPPEVEGEDPEIIKMINYYYITE